MAVPVYEHHDNCSQKTFTEIFSFCPISETRSSFNHYNLFYTHLLQCFMVYFITCNIFVATSLFQKFFPYTE